MMTDDNEKDHSLQEHFTQRQWLYPPSKQDTSTQWWPNVGPSSTTLAQHWTNIGSMYRVCWNVTWAGRRRDTEVRYDHVTCCVHNETSRIAFAMEIFSGVAAVPSALKAEPLSIWLSHVGVWFSVADVGPACSRLWRNVFLVKPLSHFHFSIDFLPYKSSRYDLEVWHNRCR